MMAPPHPPAETAGLASGPTILAVIIVVLVLWLAYRIGKMVLRVVAGLLFLGLVGYGIWYLCIR
jgi:hypothetical protein